MSRMRGTRQEAGDIETRVLENWADGEAMNVGAQGMVKRSEAMTRSMLDAASLPIAELSTLAKRESHRPRPVYSAHKWFARRFGTAMRSLLVASSLDENSDFWTSFHGEADLTGVDVADLFIGGGTSLYEAHRLGANVVGVDIDPVACMVTQFELDAHELEDPTLILADVVGAATNQRDLYRTIGPGGDEREGLHFFWVQTVECATCSHAFQAHPSWVIAQTAEQKWVLCSGCGEVALVDKDATSFPCACGVTTRLSDAPMKQGRVKCPNCAHEEQLIDYARRTEQRPRFALFAVESVPAGRTSTQAVPIKDRVLHKATEFDHERVGSARRQLADFDGPIPDRAIPSKGRSDNRLTSYGYTRYRDLFNDRQLLHLGRLLRQIDGLDERYQRSYAIAMSNHMTSNCMLTRYSERWRQVTPLFSLRAFAHSARPVELNPWLRGTGRGTFPNAVRKVSAAIEFAKHPRELSADGFVAVPTRASAGTTRVLNGDSRSQPEIPDASADLILTDPPYLDNIDYSELSDFFIPWLAAAGLINDPGGPSALSLAAKNRGEDSVASFREGLTDCFAEGARIMRPNGRLVFTFQHQSVGAWDALGRALHSSGLRIVNVFPMQGDSESSPHRHGQSTTWDAVFVLRHREESEQHHPEPMRITAEHAQACEHNVNGWKQSLHLSGPDSDNLRRATLAAAAVGFLAPGISRTEGLTLAEALENAARSPSEIPEIVSATA